MESGGNVNTAIIIGGGLVGALCASFLAKRGYKVNLYELRDDIREARFTKGRSINLALSHRGRKALAALDLESLILQTAISMKGRLLHNRDGKTKSILYDSLYNQCIYSVGRNHLNQVLLSAAEKYKNVNLYFNHKLTSIDFEQGSVTILNVKNQETLTCQADLIIGADGAFSALRRAMQQTPMFEIHQTYIEHGYLELSIPPKTGGEMVPNHLHIWPRGEFMMIALPNQDNSWTVTLFMPFDKFNNLKTGEMVLDFFQKTFPDSVPLIGKENIKEVFSKTQPSPLISIKCNPYHVGSKFLLIGDAAHAMVPFFGQGMNAGFEDCSILNEILENNKDAIDISVQEFTKRRNKDAQAICKLAMYNYVEMRDLVTRRSYYLRKLFDEFLFYLFPEKWVPLYNSVSFTNIRYCDCVENRNWQNRVIQKLSWFGFAVLVIMLSFVFVLY